MIKIFKRIVKEFINYEETRAHFSTKLRLLAKKHPNVTFLGKGRFNQEVRFWGEGKVTIGENYSFGYRYGGGYHGSLCEVQPRTKESVINIGKNIATNNGVMICSAGRIDIGDDCLIGQDVLIIDHDAHGIKPHERRSSIGNVRFIDIGNNVWIGSKVIILPGVKIGNNCIVGAGAVVTSQFPDNAVIAGNPARVIKKI